MTGAAHGELSTDRTARLQGARAPPLKRAASGRLRLSVFRSSKHIYAQVIDDIKGETLASRLVARKADARSLKTGANIDAAKAVASCLPSARREKGIKDVVFDRGGYIYHGRIKALAEAAREGGLKF